MGEVNKAQKRNACDLIRRTSRFFAFQMADKAYNGPVSRSVRRRAYAYVNRDRPLVIAMNMCLDQEHLKKVRPSTRGLNAGTR